LQCVRSPELMCQCDASSGSLLVSPAPHDSMLRWSDIMASDSDASQADDRSSVEVLTIDDSDTEIEQTHEFTTLDDCEELVEIVDTDSLIAYAYQKKSCRSALSEVDTVDLNPCSEASCFDSEHSDIEEINLPPGVPSLGTINHPHNCGRPCKYMRKKQGCKDGKTCAYCHLCVWHSRRDGKRYLHM